LKEAETVFRCCHDNVERKQGTQILEHEPSNSDPQFTPTGPDEMSEMMDVIDQAGNRLQITKDEYVRQIMQAAKSNWDNLEVLRQLAPQLLNDGFVEQSLEIAQRACEVSGGHIPDVYWRSAAQAESGRLEEAAAGFAEIQEDAAYPADVARAAIGLARVRARQGNNEEAEALINSAIEGDPENPQHQVLLYGFYNERGLADEGLQKIRELAEKSPEKTAGWRALMQIYASRKEINEIKRCATKALQTVSDRDEQDLLAEITWHFGQAGAPQEIISLLEPRIQSVHHPMAIMNLAQAYKDIGRIEHSRNLLEATLKAVPDNLKPMVTQKLNELNQPSPQES